MRIQFHQISIAEPWNQLRRGCIGFSLPQSVKLMWLDIRIKREMLVYFSDVDKDGLIRIVGIFRRFDRIYCSTWDAALSIHSPVL